MAKHNRKETAYFELSPFVDQTLTSCQLTVDMELTRQIRAIVERNITQLRDKDARNAAVVVSKMPEHELLVLIGSPDPASFEEGYKINMATEPRSIGSTIKPFIYIKAFEKGLRPYTLVDDREYKYITAAGFPLYPKNFDFQYRGKVSLHYALSNSLNVPAVKVLEYVGLESFYSFLRDDLGFIPIQNLENYQLGIALGTLEMSLFDLAKYFSIFANQGNLREIKIFQNSECQTQEPSQEKPISDPQYIQLVNKILNDRKTGIEQFGFKSELNLFQDNYALKTGTSRDFRDSWVIGYTPDFLVGVWVGNADISPTKELSGQVGAGRIWAETMELLLNSSYNKRTPFAFDALEVFSNGASIEYGLPGDDYQYYRNRLLEQDISLILHPYNGDLFVLEEDTQIILKAKVSVEWFVNEEFFGKGRKLIFSPSAPGQYQIKAIGLDEEETIVILLTK